MRYVGGKVRQASQIRKIISDLRGDRTRYVEPFVGGASVFSAVASMFDTAIGTDIIPDLILFWEAVRGGWLPPIELTEADYERLLHEAPSPLRAWAGFAASYNGRWWGGYGPRAAGRDYLAESLRATVKKARGLSNAMFRCCDYREHKIDAGTVIYCDPPYKDVSANNHRGRRVPGTSGGDTIYGAERFDSRAFWSTAETWARSGALVLVHEYEAPAGWRPLHEKIRTATMNHRDTIAPRRETLYTRDFGSE